MTFGDRVRERRRALKLTQQALSKKVRSLGGELSQQQITAIENGLVQRPRSLPELVAALETTIDYLLHGTGPPIAPAGVNQGAAVEVTPTAKEEPTEALPHTLVTRVQPVSGPPDIPLWASAAAGDDGAMIIVPDPIDYLRRSERMLHVRNPFAFNIIGSSMSPAIEHGDQVIINPSVVARPGHDCVFIHEGPEGMLALVKRLVRPSGQTWRVRQFNPLKDFDISRQKWARVHPIAEVRKAGVG